MKIVYISFIFIFLIVNQIDVLAQNNHEVTYTHQSIRFKENDTFLTDEGKSFIDTIFNRIIAVEKDTISFFNKRDFVLQSYTTFEERKRNNYIGMQRCVIILDYIESKYGINRKKFFIRDFKPEPFADPEIHFIFPRRKVYND